MQSADRKLCGPLREYVNYLHTLCALPWWHNFWCRFKAHIVVGHRNYVSLLRAKGVLVGGIPCRQRRGSWRVESVMKMDSEEHSSNTECSCISPPTLLSLYTPTRLALRYSLSNSLLPHFTWVLSLCNQIESNSICGQYKLLIYQRVVATVFQTPFLLHANNTYQSTPSCSPHSPPTHSALPSCPETH